MAILLSAAAGVFGLAAFLLPQVSASVTGYTGHVGALLLVAAALFTVGLSQGLRQPNR